MVRQFWIYLLEEDEPEFLAAIEAISPGTVVLPSKFVRGDPKGILGGDLAGLAFPELSAREHHRLVFHREASKALVAHPVIEGPLQGAQSLDTTRSDCLTLVRPAVASGRLAPARLLGETHVMTAERKLRKTPSFGAWLGAVLKRLKAAYPPSAIDFIHVSPRARAWAESGAGQLVYLHQPIAPVPKARLQSRMTTPQRR